MSSENNQSNDEAHPFDFNQLKELYGEETAIELLTMSVGESNQLITQIDKALSEKDKITAMMQAHQLKGLASTMTIHEMSSLSKQIEDELKKDNWDNAKHLTVLLKKIFTRVEDQVNSVSKK